MFNALDKNTEKFEPGARIENKNTQPPVKFTGSYKKLAKLK